MVQMPDFDAGAVDTSDNRAPVPIGDYVLNVTGSSIRESKKNRNNRYIALELTILEGPEEAKGRKLFPNFNLWNDNAEARRIGEKEFASLCKAVGKLKVSETVELHGIPFRAHVGIKTDEQYGPQNVIKKYYFEEGEKAASSAAMTTQAASGKSPWS